MNNKNRFLSLRDDPITWTPEELFILSVMFEKEFHGYSGIIEHKPLYFSFIFISIIIISRKHINKLINKFSLGYFNNMLA